ncbi:MAG: HDIG domain-containing protein [Firmicutes bacterium]|nr:HDIG domain-containing protein [Bacillota bacterium]
MIQNKKKALSKRKKTPHIWVKMLILAVFALFCTAILAIDILPAQITSQKGEVADKDIFYRGHNTEYISNLKTEKVRTEAVAQVEPIFSIDESVLTHLLANINYDFAFMESLRNNTVIEIENRLISLRNALPGEYTNETLQYVLEIDFNEMSNIRRSLREIVSTVYEQGVRDDDLLMAKDDIAVLLYRTRLSDEGLSFLLDYLNGLTLAANEFFNDIATETAKQAAKDAVPEVVIQVQKDEMLISRGAVITAEQIEALQELGMYSEKPSYSLYGGLLAIVVLLTALLGLYLYFYQPKLFAEDKSVLLLGVILLLIMLLCRLIAFIDFSADAETSAQIGFLLPVAAASMLIAVLLERNLAFFSTAILAVFVSILFKSNASYALVAFGGGLAGILSTTRLNQRSQFVSASIFIALTNVLLIGGWGLLNNQNFSIIGIGMVIGLFNGVLSAVLAMGILPFLESAFSVTTVVRLLEFSNLNHPLLKRLMMEAPGTYNHCVLVGNLAETAADAIGANALLVRVASYYHDVGKLKRPYLFIENQGLNDNPHDKLQPSLSVMIITSHVREGVEMLRQARFPEEIISLVEQHHGTGLLRMFYKKAQEQSLDSSLIREEDFRYPYSKPQSKEAALVLLADMTQAAAQALKQAAKGQIEETVHNIIKGRMEDGQLLECPLTFQDMQLIEEAFLRVLSGMNHSRLVYPEQMAKESRGNSVDIRPNYNQEELAKRSSSSTEIAAQGSPLDH